MMYKQRTFTLPAANPGQSEVRWDLGMLTEQEFEQKYGKSKDKALLELES